MPVFISGVGLPPTQSGPWPQNQGDSSKSKAFVVRKIRPHTTVFHSLLELSEQY